MSKSLISGLIALVLYFICDFLIATAEIVFQIIRDFCYCGNYVNSTFGVYSIKIVFVILVCGFIYSVAFAIFKKIIKRPATVLELSPVIAIVVGFGIMDIWTAFHHGFLGSVVMLTAISRLFAGYLFVYTFANGLEKD